jgi:Transposase DDE domain
VVETKKELTEKDIVCLGHLSRVFPLLDKLMDVGCARDTAGNRKFHFNDFCKLVLLYTWNPVITSVRDLQRVAALPNVAKALGVERFSLGSFSESCRVFEPELLKAVIEELAGELRPLPQNPRLPDLKHALTLVDGTVLEALPRLARAACADTHVLTQRDGRELHAFKLHVQLDLSTFQVSNLKRTGACNAGELRESAVLQRSLESGRCYVGDAAFAVYGLLDDIIDKGSSFVMRIREDCAHKVISERPLTPEARAAGIIRDVLVTLGGAESMKHQVRLITLEIEPHQRRTRKAERPHGGTTNKAYKGQRVCDRLMIVTSHVDLAADLSALIYRQRYSVELFFRFLKQLLGMRHLLNRRAEGIDTQVYCAVIVCLLINLMTGKKPNRGMVSMMGFHLLGLATDQDILDYLNKPDNTGAKLKIKEAMWKNLGY